MGAAIAQMHKLPTHQMLLHRPNMAAIDVAEKVLAIAPGPMSKIWPANSGSEANDHMVKFLWYYNNGRG
jgi:4-aminobutyrate--pyruvate transaminase